MVILGKITNFILFTIFFRIFLTFISKLNYNTIWLNLTDTLCQALIQIGQSFAL